MNNKSECSVIANYQNNKHTFLNYVHYNFVCFANRHQSIEKCIQLTQRSALYVVFSCIFHSRTNVINTAINGE